MCVPCVGDDCDGEFEVEVDEDNEDDDDDSVEREDVDRGDVCN